jgi:ribosomal protein S18 acetylase RimI-like enzyme
MKPVLKCRVANETDADALLRMMDPFNTAEGIPFSADKFRPPLLKLLGSNQLGAVLVFETGALAGYAVVTWGYDLEFGGRDAFLTEFWIEPQARGTGFGRRALALAEEYAKAQGAHALHLGVRHDNAPATRLYESSGYHGWPRRYMTKLL